MKHQHYTSLPLGEQLERLKAIWPDLRSGSFGSIVDRWNQSTDCPPWVQGPLVVIKEEFFGRGKYYGEQVHEMIRSMNSDKIPQRVYLHEAGKFLKATGFGRRKETYECILKAQGMDDTTDLFIVGAAFILPGEICTGVKMDSICALSTVIMDPACMADQDSPTRSILGDYLWSENRDCNPCIGRAGGGPGFDLQVSPGNPPFSVYPHIWAPNG